MGKNTLLEVALDNPAALFSRANDALFDSTAINRNDMLSLDSMMRVFDVLYSETNDGDARFEMELFARLVRKAHFKLEGREGWVYTREGCLVHADDPMCSISIRGPGPRYTNYSGPREDPNRVFLRRISLSGTCSVGNLSGWSYCGPPGKFMNTGDIDMERFSLVRLPLHWGNFDYWIPRASAEFLLREGARYIENFLVQR
jgi:hypothetical protein